MIRKGTPLQSKLKTVKLFDVDVKIAKDQVVRIEMTEADDPWKVSRYFQSSYNLTNEATAALYELLQQNFDSEMQKRQNPDKIQIRRVEVPHRFQTAEEEIEQPTRDEDNIVSTGAQSHEAISERNDEESSDDCDILSDNYHLDESVRLRV